MLEVCTTYTYRYNCKLVPVLEKYLHRPSKCNPWIPLKWKNNGCKSMNHVLKLTIDWKVQKVPELVRKLYTIFQLQYAEVQLVLHGTGNYEITPAMARFRIPQMRWIEMSEEQKKHHYQRFLNAIPGSGQSTISVTSTDSRLRIPRTPHAARKPGQHKRVKNAKTSLHKKVKV